MPETTVFDHYEVLRRDDGSLFELGRGAMGITYKAFDTNLRCPVALKVINAGSIHSEIARQRFVREARAAAQLRHRHVASVFHLGSEGDTYYYAMEFIDGETVESFIRRSGPMLPVLALRIAVQVARALNAAQRHQLVHRDIKPSNLMLVHEDEELVVKVIDFGLAKSNRGDEVGEATSAGFVGTPHFASPEQLDELELDVRSDIYSLGVTLWYMLTAEPPFGGTIAQVMSKQLHSAPPMERLKNLPGSLRALLMRMLAKDPAKRQQTPVELRAGLEKCIDEISAASPVGAETGVVLLPESGRGNEIALKNKGFYAGATVGGRYELLRELGESSAGWMFQAEDLHDGSRVRLLVLQAEFAGDGAAFTRIEHEVEKMRGIMHPNIQRVLGMEHTPEANYILMEWTDGFSLLDLLRSRRELDGDETALLLRQIAAGVDEAVARGLRHIDFSLAQILVHFPVLEEAPERRLTVPVDRWPQFIVKINALGIAREFGASDTWAGGQTIVGDLAAAAAREEAGVSGRHCVQSLGAVVYEMLGGTLSPGMLGVAQNAARYVPVAALPEAGNEVVKQALDPRGGFATAMEFFNALEATLSGDYRAQPVPTPEPRYPTQAGTVSPPSFRAAHGVPSIPRARGNFPWLAVGAISALVVAAALLLVMNHSASRGQIAGNESAASSPAAVPPDAASPVATLAPAASTPAPATPVPATPSPMPVAATPDPDAPMKAKLAEGEAAEAAHDLPKAISSYVDLIRKFPGVDTGRIRLESLLSSQLADIDKMSPGDYAALRPALADAAAQGVISAMVILGDRLRGEAPREAFAWYSAAAARGNPSAMTLAGLMEANGAGMPADATKAVKWFQWAADSGDAAGKDCLADCYLHGTGVPRDDQHAVDLLQQAVSAGDARAMNTLGTCYSHGTGVTQDFAQAMKLFNQAHDLGFKDAAANLGVCYMNGSGVDRDLQKGVNLFAEGAGGGSAICMYQLAQCLEFGTGIGKNGAEAETWYRKAALGGIPMAQEWCRAHHIPLQKP